MLSYCVQCMSQGHFIRLILLICHLCSPFIRLSCAISAPSPLHNVLTTPSPESNTCNTCPYSSHTHPYAPSPVLSHCNCRILSSYFLLSSLRSAKQFREALSKKHDMDCGLAMIIKQRAKVRTCLPYITDHDVTVTS